MTLRFGQLSQAIPTGHNKVRQEQLAVCGVEWLNY